MIKKEIWSESSPGYFNIVAYFKGEQSLGRAFTLSFLLILIGIAYYFFKINSFDSITSWKPLRNSLSILFIVSTYSLWMLWKCRNNTNSIELNIVARVSLIFGLAVLIFLVVGAFKWRFINIYIVIFGVLVAIFIYVLTLQSPKGTDQG